MAAPQSDAYTVSQLTRRIKALIEDRIGTVWVSGEISNWRVSPAGHAYFTLKDDTSQIDAVMFRGKLSRLRFDPESGLEVLALGLVSVYERRGNYQIICDDLQPKGLGALQLAFEKLRAKLQAEGLFDDAHKKPIPAFPRRIGMVTSPTGAAIRDMLNVIGRRFAHVHILIYPARVQGEEAADEIVAGIRALDRLGVDVMIVGRGGGSLEDLWPFNEEAVVRAVYAAQTPIISAVGHEIDYTLCDFAADLRAPTPSAAAELVVRERQHIVETLKRLEQRLSKVMTRAVEQGRNRLNLAQSSFVFRRPEELVRQHRQRLDEVRQRLETETLAHLAAARTRVDRAGRALPLLSPVRQLQRMADRLKALRGRVFRAGRSTIDRHRNALRPLLLQLDTLSPLGILARGYALAWKLPERHLVRSAKDLDPGDALALRFGEGTATARVEDVEPDLP